jgi:hypothetical protein|nr:MAG TPA: hypothetical protein [Caudoviricetes sp.]
MIFVGGILFAVLVLTGTVVGGSFIKYLSEVNKLSKDKAVKWLRFIVMMSMLIIFTIIYNIEMAIALTSVMMILYFLVAVLGFEKGFLEGYYHG